MTGRLRGEYPREGRTKRPRGVWGRPAGEEDETKHHPRDPDDGRGEDQAPEGRGGQPSTRGAPATGRGLRSVAPDEEHHKLEAAS